MTFNDGFMFVSNLVFLVSAWVYVRAHLPVDGLIRLLVFLASTNYHICYGMVLDPETSDLGHVCTFSMQYIYISLVFDLIFANVANLSSFMKLLPQKNNYGWSFRYFLCIIGGFFVFIACAVNGSMDTGDFITDHSQSVIIAAVSYYFFLYAAHVFVFFPDSSTRWKEISEYYHTNFHVSWIYGSLGGFFVGVSIWTLLQSFYPDMYFYSHPFWHIITGLADIFFGSFAFKYSENGETIFRAHWWNIWR